MPIEEIKEGDKVWAKDPQTGESGYYTVTWTTNHVTDEVVQITVSGSTDDSFVVNELSLSYNGDFIVEPAGIAGAKRLGSRSGSSSGASPAPASDYSETIEATAAHPIWVVGKGWVDAGALVVGDKLLAKDGSYLTVTKLGLVKKQIRVYNFEVAKLHTYFVGGQQQWLVHNTIACKRYFTTPWGRKVHYRLDIDWDLERPSNVFLPGRTNLEAARQGYAPGRFRPDNNKWEVVALHHLHEDPRGSLAEVWFGFHSRIKHQRESFINGSGIKMSQNPAR